MYLFAISVPGNVEARFEECRRMVFRAAGDLSCIAFPPVIPLCVFQDRPFNDFSRVIRRRDFINPAVFAGEISLTLLRRSGLLSFRGEIPGWDEILSVLKEASGTSAGINLELPDFFSSLKRNFSLKFPIFITKPGLFMGYDEGGFEESNEEGRLGWKRGELVCLEWISPSDGGWWEKVFFNQL